MNEPWTTEPDREQWTDSETGLVCLARRGPLSAWCGYVGIPESHPWHGKGYSECLASCGDSYCFGHAPESKVEVHGGLTYSAPCDGDPEDGICHVPEDGQPDHLWWFGFDCAHAFDLVPRMRQYGPESGTYRDLAFVRAETTRLARQLGQVRRESQ